MHYLFLLVYMHGLIYSRRSTYYWPIRLNFGRCEEMASLSAINGARKCHAGYIRVAFVSWRVNLPRGSRYYNSRNKDASHGATITRRRGVRICISILFGLGSNPFYFLILMITLYVGRGIENLLRISQFDFLILVITLYVGRGIGRRQKRHRLKAFQPYKILTKQNRTE